MTTWYFLRMFYHAVMRSKWIAANSTGTTWYRLRMFYHENPRHRLHIACRTTMAADAGTHPLKKHKPPLACDTVNPPTPMQPPIYTLGLPR